jgi:hypothetical protein
VASERPAVARYSGPKPYLVSRNSPSGGPSTQEAENTDRITEVNVVTARPEASASSLV